MIWDVGGDEFCLRKGNYREIGREKILFLKGILRERRVSKDFRLIVFGEFEGRKF